MAKIATSTIPNTFTLSNLGCGVLSLIMTFQGNYTLACYFVLLASLIDRYDGRVARYFNVVSDIGKELDSLADLVSFGVAPSILVFNINNLSNFGVFGYLLVLIFPLAGAYRLARYNVVTFDGTFSGIPITLAGMSMVLYTLITIDFNISISVTIILIILLSYLMVSKLKLKKF